MRKTTALGTVFVLFVTGCSAAPETVATTTTTSTTQVEETTTSTEAETTTTTVAETSTTTAPVVAFLDESGPGLEALIATFYGRARGDTDAVPPAPEAMVPEPGTLKEGATVNVHVATARYGEGSIGVWTAGKDVVGVVQDGSGWRIVAGTAPSVGVAPHLGGMPMHVAVVGSDARRGQDVESSRADSIHIVGLDGGQAAGIVGIPRDSWVSVDGGGHDKINSALANGGPEAMMKTFDDLVGYELDGYVLTGFEGFERLVDDVLEPFEIDMPFTFSDRAAKADFEEGTQVIDGDQALAFARTRKAFLTGDFQRQLNGGFLLLSAAIGAKVRGPLAVPEMISGTREWMYTDLSPEQLLTLSLAVHRLKPWEIDNVVVKGGTGTSSGGASIVRLDSGAVEAVFADLEDGRLED